MIPAGIVYIQKRDFKGNLTGPMPCVEDKTGWAVAFLRAIICKDQEAAHDEFTRSMERAKPKTPSKMKAK